MYVYLCVPVCIVHLLTSPLYLLYLRNGLPACLLDSASNKASTDFFTGSRLDTSRLWKKDGSTGQTWVWCVGVVCGCGVWVWRYTSKEEGSITKKRAMVINTCTNFAVLELSAMVFL